VVGSSGSSVSRSAQQERDVQLQMSLCICCKPSTHFSTQKEMSVLRIVTETPVTTANISCIPPCTVLHIAITRR
jgi:hypothetical protein